MLTEAIDYVHKGSHKDKNMIRRFIAVVLLYTLTYGIGATLIIFLSRQEVSHYGKEVSQLESVSITFGLLLYPIGLLLMGVAMFVFHRRRIRR